MYKNVLYHLNGRKHLCWFWNKLWLKSARCYYTTKYMQNKAYTKLVNVQNNKNSFTVSRKLYLGQMKQFHSCSFVERSCTLRLNCLLSIAMIIFWKASKCFRIFYVQFINKSKHHATTKDNSFSTSTPSMTMAMSSGRLRASLSRITKTAMVVFSNSRSASSLWSA